MKKDISIDFDITWTNFWGAFVILVGLLSLPFTKKVEFTTYCLTIGGALMGVAKVANTAYDNIRVEEDINVQVAERTDK